MDKPIHLSQTKTTHSLSGIVGPNILFARNPGDDQDSWLRFVTTSEKSS